MSGEITQAEFLALRGEESHPSGCTFEDNGSCGWWAVSSGCDLEHYERHVGNEDGRCACGLNLGEEGPVIGQADDF